MTVLSRIGSLSRAAPIRTVADFAAQFMIKATIYASMLLLALVLDGAMGTFSATSCTSPSGPGHWDCVAGRWVGPSELPVLGPVGEGLPTLTKGR